MVSPTAIADIKTAISSGIQLKPEEIVRLNALGLRYDYSKSGAEMRIMPRLAWLGDVAFREPTIGHEIWMFDMADVFDLEDGETRIKVRAFCLATDPKELPSVDLGILELKKIVAEFCRKRLSSYTLGQVAAALVFAEYGNIQTAREIPAQKQPSRKKKTKPVPEGEYCYEIGVMRNGVLLNLGSPDELRGLTVSELETLVQEKMKLDNRFGANYAKDVVSTAFADYKRTLGEILDGHKKSEEVKS